MEGPIIYNYNDLIQLYSRTSNFSEDIWVPIIGFKEIVDDEYGVSSNGLINDLLTGELYSPYNDSQGYFALKFRCKDGSKTTYRIHQIVKRFHPEEGEPFVDDENQSEWHVNHKNGNQFDNYYKNLEYLIPVENAIHATINNIATTHILNDKQIKLVCETLVIYEGNVDQTFMHLYINTPRDQRITKHIIRDIRRRLAHTEISVNYNW